MTIFVVETDSGLYNCLSLAGHELGEARIWDTSDVGAFQCRSPPKSPGLEPNPPPPPKPFHSTSIGTTILVGHRCSLARAVAVAVAAAMAVAMATGDAAMARYDARANTLARAASLYARAR
jgi:hypothetical protein